MTSLARIVNNMNNVSHMSANLDVRGEVFEFFDQKPHAFMEQLQILFGDKSLQNRQIAMFLLNEVSKDPVNLGELDEVELNESVINFYNAIRLQNGNLNCSLKFKAIGILLAKHAPIDNIRIICNQIKQNQNVQKWLMALSQFLSRIKKLDNIVRYQINQLMTFFITNTLKEYSQEEIEEIFKTFTQFVKISNALGAAINQTQIFSEFVDTLAALVIRFNKFQHQRKLFIFQDICDSTKINKNRSNLIILYQYTKTFLHWAPDMVDVWTNIISELDFKMDDELQRSFKNLFTETSIIMIDNIKKYDSQFIGNGQPVIRSRVLHENSFIKSLVFSSARLLILLNTKISNKDINDTIMSLVNQDIKFYNSLGRGLLQAVYFSLPLNYAIKGKQLQLLSDEVFKKYSQSFNMLEMIQPQAYQEQAINTQLFAVTNIISSSHKVFMEQASYFFGKIYLFIMNISKFKLSELTTHRTRQALEVVLDKGKQYLVSQGRFSQLFQIVNLHILRTFPTQTERQIKDLVLEYGIALLHNKIITRLQKLQILQQIIKIYYIDKLGKSDIDSISKFLSQLFISLNGLNELNSQKDLLNRYLGWIISNIEKSNDASLFLPLKEALFFNNEFTMAKLVANYTKIQKCSKLYPVVFIPVCIEILKSSNKQSSDLKSKVKSELVRIFMCQLGQAKMQFERIKKVLDNIEKAVYLYIFTQQQNQLIKVLLTSFKFVNKIDAKIQQKSILKVKLLKIIKMYITSEMNFRLDSEDIKLYRQFLQQQFDFLTLKKWSYFPAQLQFKAMILQLNHQIMARSYPQLMELATINKTIVKCFNANVINNDIKNNQLMELNLSICHCLYIISEKK